MLQKSLPINKIIKRHLNAMSRTANRHFRGVSYPFTGGWNVRQDIRTISNGRIKNRLVQ
jgi:hypothetical protein